MDAAIFSASEGQMEQFLINSCLSCLRTSFVLRTDEMPYCTTSFTSETNVSLFPMFPIISLCYEIWGVRSSVVVKALCYKPEGRGFETR
jgi:hypothetical protein